MEGCPATQNKVVRGLHAAAVRDDARRDLLGAVDRIATNMAGGEPFLRLLAHRLGLAANESALELVVLDALLPPVAELSRAATTQILWNAEARASALAEFGALTAAQVIETRGTPTANPHLTLSRWLRSGRVFAIDTSAGRLFPAFQFRDGKPLPEMRPVLHALAGHLGGWEVLLWFTGSSGFLDGRRPVDLLVAAPGEVVAAATREAGPSDD